MKIVKYNSTYLKSVLELLNICLPEKHITKQSFLWRYFSPFFKGKTICVLAVNDNKRVCSFVCFTPVKIANPNGNTKKFYCCAFQATHPDFRRQGLVTKLTKYVEKELGKQAEYIGFSNADGIKIDQYSQTINYTILGRFYTKYVPSLPYKTTITTSQTNKIQELNTDNTEHHIRKDSHYLNWRYKSDPRHDYLYLSLLKKNRLFGLAVCKTFKNKLDVLDLRLTDCSRQAIRESFQSIAKYAFESRKPIVAFAHLHNKNWDNCFPRLSFTKKQPIHFVVKSHRRKIKNCDAWMIQGGDIQ